MKIKTLILVGVFLLLNACSFRPLLDPNKGDMAKAKEYFLTQGSELLGIDTTKSIAAYEMALELDPSDPRALDGLACNALYERDLVKAEKILQHAILVGPSYSPALVHLAVVRFLNKDPSWAKLIDEALYVNPLDKEARYLKEQLNSNGGIDAEKFQLVVRP